MKERQASVVRAMEWAWVGYVAFFFVVLRRPRVRACCSLNSEIAHAGGSGTERQQPLVYCVTIIVAEIIIIIIIIIA